MQIVLLWRLDGDDSARRSAIERAGSRLRTYCRDLFDKEPDVVTFDQAGHALLYLELPVLGWKPRQLESDGRRWALALDYPVDADAAAEQRDDPTGDDPLLRFARSLEESPATALERVSPGWSLVFGEHSGDRIEVQNDCLGFHQMLEYTSGSTWALTNRPLALRALDIDLVPEPGEWAARALLGWCPLDRTGFKNLRALSPGTRLTLTSRGRTRVRHDALRSLLSAPPMSPSDALELAATSVRAHVTAAARFWTSAGIAFSSGRDSRAVVASMIGAGVPIDHVRTHGRKSNREMIIARHLAKTAGLRHLLQTRRGFPPATEASLRHSVALAARWQCGMTETKAFKTFCPSRSHLGTGKVNIMGKHGEIGRGYYLHRARKISERPEESRASLIHYLTSTDADLLRSEVRDEALELIRASVAQADEYGLEDEGALDFFYLFERTRRWASGTIYSQRDKVITPFLNPSYIRAAFRLPAEYKLRSAVQDHIVRSNMPAWDNVPYLTDRIAWQWCKRNAGKLRRTLWSTEALLDRMWNRHRASYGRDRGTRYGFDNLAYWQTVGAPFVREALERGDLVNRVFDRKRLAERWPKEPDVLAVTYAVERAVAGS